jgi:hypothetical protein
MRRAPLHPRQWLAYAFLSFMLFLALTLAAAPDLSTMDFSIGSESGGAAPAPAAPTDDPLVPGLDQIGPFAAGR